MAPALGGNALKTRSFFQWGMNGAALKSLSWVSFLKTTASSEQTERGGVWDSGASDNIISQ